MNEIRRYGPLLIPFLACGSLAGILYVGNLIIFSAGPGLGVDVTRLPWFDPKADPNGVVGLRDGSGRLLWGLAGVVQTITFLVAIAYFGYALQQSLERIVGKNRRKWWCLFACCLIV